MLAGICKIPPSEELLGGLGPIRCRLPGSWRVYLTYWTIRLDFEEAVIRAEMPGNATACRSWGCWGSWGGEVNSTGRVGGM